MSLFQRRIASLALLLVVGCFSPNRGTWTGTFQGDVTGVFEFRINARGTHLTGRMEGKTRDGSPFTAKMEGALVDPHLEAAFEGTSRVRALPVFFDGSMAGELGEGVASGDWNCTLRRTQIRLKGTWEVEQVPES